MSRRKVKPKQKGKRFCFAGKHYVWGTEIVKMGRTQAGRMWFLCRDCQESHRRHKELDEEVMRVGDGKGHRVEMGWNGVPSAKALRRRSR
jgi:hypothetical protein